MSINKNVVEDALFQIRNLEETLQENAKGILQSTMSEEIKQLVKESLKEQEEIDEPAIEDEDEMEMDDVSMDDEDEMGMEDEMDMEDEMGMDDEDEMGMDDMSMDDEDEMGMDDEMDMDDEDAIDMTDASDEEVLKVFKAMGDEDGIIVKKEDDFIHLTDEDDDYLIQLGESYGEDDLEEEFGFDGNLEEGDDSEYHEGYNAEFDEFEEKIYEIVMDGDFEEVKLGMEEEYDSLEEEGYGDGDLEEALMEAIKKSIKPKGVGIGKGPKFGYDKKPNMSGGFNEKKKEAFGKGTKAMGTGKAKFEFKEGEYGMNKGDKSKTHKGEKDYTTKKGMTNSKGEEAFKKEETKEASRTYGSGSKEGRGLKKARMNNRNFEYNPFKISESKSNEEVQLLKEKNEEYKQALDVFRTKLNEVAVFNSNLAYSTRLFTEHSTTKQEKINILRRFDNIESLKESKNLYKTIKGELSSNGAVGEQKINESIERTVNKTVETGSAVNLIESKTYENPQFLRMKDLMGKLK